MNSAEAVPASLDLLLSPVLAGAEAQFYEAQLRDIFGPAAEDGHGELSLDDCLGARRACLLCITPRSGSTYLRSLMQSTGQLGFAAEFMNLEEGSTHPFDIRKMVAQHGFRALESYLRFVIDKTSAPTNVFAMKGDLYQYVPVSYTHLTLPTNREV